MKLTHDEIEERLEKSKRADGTYDVQAIVDMNKLGIIFSFTRSGVSWRQEEMIQRGANRVKSAKCPPSG